jgi:UDP-N-acetylglucosamine 2-epimerase (non-hydrolysing)
VKYLVYRDQPISSISEAAAWFLVSCVKIVFGSKSPVTGTSKNKDFVIVHGDTLSTFLGLTLSIRFRKSLGHIEAGLRSHRIFHPFPEELVRRIVGRFSDLNFAPSDEAMLNLQDKRGVTIHTYGNTTLDAMALFDQSSLRNPKDAFCLVLLHRTELVRNSKLMKETLDEIGMLSKKIPVVMVQDYVSEERMRNLVKHFPEIKIIGKQDFFSFQSLLRTSSFVITDSGGLQEECAAIGKPCLVHRVATERSDGIGVNALLSRCEKGQITDFFNIYRSFERPIEVKKSRPTSIIVDSLRELRVL